MKISEKLVRIRAELNLSQEALAKELNVSFTSINRWENEKTVPSRKTQMMIDTHIYRIGLYEDAIHRQYPFLCV